MLYGSEVVFLICKSKILLDLLSFILGEFPEILFEEFIDLFVSDSLVVESTDIFFIFLGEGEKVLILSD